MKKIISVLLSVVMFCGTGVTSFAAEFSDFNRNHWAYEYVNTLVESGTINGFEDGTFRPEVTVTRAEFVKMIGYGPERYGNDFDDVPVSHWAYEYIMTSGLEALTGNVFSPDVAITRGDVVNLLWKRSGSPDGIVTPPVIHRQGKNHEAVSWAYSKGIMTGDDNINLRLNDSLTRAEAAALIVRAANVSGSVSVTEFLNAVDGDVFRVAYDAFKVVDKPYGENDTLTNGELAMAAARIICDADKPDYGNVSATKSFDHIYAQPVNMLCRYYLGENCDNAEYADKNATVGEAVAALMFAITKSANSPVSAGAADANYPLAANESNAALKKLLSIAYNNGICFTTPDAMPLDKELTLREFACLLVEFDGFSGFYTADRLGFSTYYKDYKISTDLASYPSNSGDYRIILADVPAHVYEAPFVSAVSLPKDSYIMTNEYKSIFESMIVTWLARAYQKGVTLAATYYPGLCANNGNGYTMRIHVEVESGNSGMKLSDVVLLADSGVEDFELVAGDEFYADIETGIVINDVRVPADKMKITAVIR